VAIPPLLSTLAARRHVRGAQRAAAAGANRAARSSHRARTHGLAALGVRRAGPRTLRSLIVEQAGLVLGLTGFRRDRGRPVPSGTSDSTHSPRSSCAKPTSTTVTGVCHYRPRPCSTTRPRAALAEFLIQERFGSCRRGHYGTVVLLRPSTKIEASLAEDHRRRHRANADHGTLQKTPLRAEWWRMRTAKAGDNGGSIAEQIQSARRTMTVFDFIDKQARDLSTRRTARGNRKGVSGWRNRRKAS